MLKRSQPVSWGHVWLEFYEQSEPPEPDKLLNGRSHPLTRCVQVPAWNNALFMVSSAAGVCNRGNRASCNHGNNTPDSHGSPVPSWEDHRRVRLPDDCWFYSQFRGLPISNAAVVQQVLPLINADMMVHRSSNHRTTLKSYILNS